jgi:hypothetical protein
MTPQSAALMAEYNRWMNERMYEAAATLGSAELVADRSAFFGSIFGTLNHIAAGDSRGQASTLLFQAGIDVGVTDLLALVPNTEA